MSKKLTGSFLDELLKLCFVKKSFLEIVSKKLQYHYIPKEFKHYKLILQSIINQYSLNGKLPSYGVISQQYDIDPDVQNALKRIKDCDIIDQELALKQLYDFIRDIKFQLLFEDVYDSYNKGSKDDALEMFISGAKELSDFKIKDETDSFVRVFSDFKYQISQRQIDKEAGEDVKEKVPIGIDVLDALTEGGIDNGDTALWIMRSGVGKSTALKHTGMAACRLGYRVLHIQLEGGKKEAYDKYTQIWTASTFSQAKWGDIPREKMVEIEKVIKEMESRQREIHIFSFERFGSATMIEVRDVVYDYQKVMGCFPDLIIIDSLDLAKTGENKKVDNDPEYKKERLQLVAQRMKDLAVEVNSRIITATQTGDIAPERYNNPDWVITRNNTEGDRTLVKPFSYVFTGNQTIDEKKKNIMRIHVDKFRNYDTKEATYPICTAYEFGKFYDKAKTMKDYSYMYK